MSEPESYKTIKVELAEVIRHHWKQLLVFSVLSIIGGIGCLISPFYASVTIAPVVGISLIAMSIPLFAMSLRAPGQKHQIVAGIGFFIAAALGCLMLFNPSDGIILIAVSIAAYFFIHGIAKIVMSFKLPSDADRAMATVSGTVSILAGIIVAKFFEDTTNNTDALAAGVGLIFSGFTWLRLALRYRNQDWWFQVFATR